MQDVKLTADAQGNYDLVIENDQISSVEGFETTLIVSLMTDARAPASLVPQAHMRRGWVGDISTAESATVTGSTLWVLDQSRMIKRTFAQAQLFTVEALQHLIDNKNAKGVNVTVNPSQRKIDIETEIVINENIVERYNTLWRITNASGLSNT